MRGLRGLRAGTAETEAGQVEATGQVEAAATGHARHAAALHGRGERPHLLLLQVLGRPVGVTDRGEHEVGDGPRGLLRVVGVHRGRLDAEIQQLALAVDGGLDQAAARRAGHLGVRQCLLGIHELFLHLLRRGEQLLHIHLGFHIALLRRAYDHPSAVKPLRRAGLSLRIRRSPDRPARAG